MTHISPELQQEMQQAAKLTFLVFTGVECEGEEFLGQRRDLPAAIDLAKQAVNPRSPIHYAYVDAIAADAESFDASDMRQVFHTDYRRSKAVRELVNEDRAALGLPPLENT
jgi:hypothetical protein